MATFLELVNDLRRESGAGGGQPALGTLGGSLSYENQRYKNWIIKAWRDIQTLHRTWLFMEGEFQIAASAGDFEYQSSDASPAITFANWKRDTFRCWNTAAGVNDEQLLPFLAYEEFRNLYRYGSMRTTQQRPVFFTVTPDKKLWLGPVPDAAYTIEGRYYRAPQILAADGDTPTGIDSEFHDLIWMWALKKYAAYEAAPEVDVRSDNEAGPLLARLEADYLPKMTSGPPLA